MKLDILVIDDSTVNLLLIEHHLHKLTDCTTWQFTNPFEALSWSQHQCPDLVIVDYMMPEMNGIEFIKQFRALNHCQDLPLLMLTANNQVEIRHAALEMGANDFLTKPIDKIEFIARSKNMLSLRRNQRNLQDRAAWLSDEVNKATQKLLERERETIVRLSKAADSRDPETGAHISRMAHFSKLIASNLGLSKHDQQLILDASPMHDIGKVAIPDEILLKKGRLTPSEFDIMKKHAELGFQILKDSPSEILQAAAQIALAHHEKFDGSGYPRGLKGEDIPLFARICSVADVFDALTSARPYKTAWSDERAINLLHVGSGKHFDPRCVDAFLQDFSAIICIREQFVD